MKKLLWLVIPALYLMTKKAIAPDNIARNIQIGIKSLKLDGIVILNTSLSGTLVVRNQNTNVPILADQVTGTLYNGTQAVATFRIPGPIDLPALTETDLPFVANVTNAQAIDYLTTLLDGSKSAPLLIKGQIHTKGFQIPFSQKVTI